MRVTALVTAAQTILVITLKGATTAVAGLWICNRPEDRQDKGFIVARAELLLILLHIMHVRQNTRDKLRLLQIAWRVLQPVLCTDLLNRGCVHVRT